MSSLESDSPRKKRPTTLIASLIVVIGLLGGGYYLAREALISLGYNFTEAEAALAGADPALDVEELVKGALKKMAR